MLCELKVYERSELKTVWVSLGSKNVVAVLVYIKSVITCIVPKEKPDKTNAL